MKRQRVTGPMITRAANLDPQGIIDDAARRVRLSFSSETPYLRASFFDEPWVEVLGHADTEVDLSRMAGAPLLFNHDSRSIANHIGVVERAWVEGGRGVAEVRFSNSADVEPVWHRVKEGTLTNVSVGYQIHERTLVRTNDGGGDEYRVTRWTPMEISAVPLPADATVGINRAFKISDIEPETATDDTARGDVPPDADSDDGRAMARPTQRGDNMTTETTAAAPEVDLDAIRQQAQKDERTRIEAIRHAVLTARLGEALAVELIEAGSTVDAARARIIDEWSRAGGPPTDTHRAEQPDAATWEQLLAAAQKDGLSRREAIHHCARLHPNAHREYLTRINTRTEA